MTKIDIPSFKSEAEEARWWFDHSEELDDEFLAAASEGRLTQGTLAKQFGLVPHLVRIDPSDALLAQRIAARRGLDYEQYLQEVIHDALAQNARTLEPEGTSSPAVA